MAIPLRLVQRVDRLGGRPGRWLAAVVAWLAAIAPARAEPPAAPCITDFMMAQDVVLAGPAVRFCDDRRKNQSCFVVELATGKVSPAGPDAPAPPPRIGRPVEVHGKTARFCRADGGCKTLKPRAHVDDMLGMSGTANPAETLAALINAHQVETFDLKTGKRIAGFTAGTGACTWVTIPGETLVVQNEECGGGAGTSWLASRTGARIAAVGGDQPFDAMGPVFFEGRAAFVAKAGDAVVVQNLRTGKVENRIAIGPAADDAKPVMVGDSRQLVIVFGGARWGDVAVVDLATGKLTTHAAKRCPK